MTDPTREEWDRMRREDERLEAQEMQAALDDANREMFPDDYEYLEAAGIDDLGAK